MKKLGYAILILFLVFSTVFAYLSWSKSEDVALKIKEKETTIQGYKKKIQHQKAEIKTLSEITSKKESVSTATQQAIARDTAQQALRIENEKMLKILFSYTSLEVRSKALEPFITDELNKKMRAAASDTDSHAGEIVSEYNSAKVYVNMDSKRYSTWNTVNAVVNGQKLEIYVQIDYIYQQGGYKVTKLLFKE
ncbi:hypothetical protein HB943_05350 [Listeria weihenstephanensis]|uniref:Uncharacterized protein n=1 Tax=Listeria weihenstephanensis TaxID=1006155 RepID=A0A841Z5V2_9LIST|nr:hypothetical protein [Listeria weihenstephanensis]MBC1500022.1 hypothetical protein [Listeria weihenstephanensis]